MLACGAGRAGEAARARLQGAALSQAAQAFKAALPHAGLPEFRRWLQLVGARVGLGPALALEEQVMQHPPYTRSKLGACLPLHASYLSQAHAYIAHQRSTSQVHGGCDELVYG